MYRENKIAIVVPAYNEERLLGKVISTMPDYVDEIIVVDDGSRDATFKVANSHKTPKLKVLRHEQNMGVGAAIISGYKIALEDGADITAVMAGDAQMDPAQLSRLLDPIVDGKADYTKGNRLFGPTTKEIMPVFRLIGNSILSFLTKISSGYWGISDFQNGYTAISRNGLITLDLDAIFSGYGYCNDILVKMNVHNLKVKDVNMPPLYGKEKSKISILSYTLILSLLLITRFVWRMKEKYVIRDFHPLVLFYLLGFILLPIGILIAMIIVKARIITGHVVSSSAILSSLFIISGLQLILFAMLFDMESSRDLVVR